jgi:hypothetical protein
MDVLPAAPRRRGRPVGTKTVSDADALNGRTVYLSASSWDWLAKWHAGNESAQLRAVFDRAERFWPGGPFDNSARPVSAAPRPGGKIELRRRIRALEAQIMAAGLEPVNDERGVNK